MGLDMYLSRRAYVKNGRHVSHNDTRFVELRHGEAIHDLTPYIRTIELEVAYWRKEHGIHQWFVTNVQDGKDDCDTYKLSKKKLEELRNDLHQALTTPEDSPYEELVECTSREQLRHSIAILDDALAAPDYGRYFDDFLYRASW